MRLNNLRVGRAHADERGAAAILVAVAMVGLLLAGALVLDFGIVRVERQVSKLAADSAVMAGLRAGDTGSGQMNTAAAICGAVDFLRSSNPNLSGLASPPCSPPPVKICNPEDPTTFTTYTGTTQSGRTTYEVTIRSAYTFEGSGFPEDDLTSLREDVGMEDWNGCDQLAVIVRQRTETGLGLLAGREVLDTRIRSVGRVNLGDGAQAPALLLLDRKNCGVLQVGSAGGGNTSEIKVYGYQKQPGTIHADSDASVCTGRLIVGNKADGLVAYGAPNDDKPGSITSVAGFLGKPLTVIRDNLANVYAASGPVSSPGTPLEPTGRPIVTRAPVDKRYLEGVRAAVTEANGVAFSANAASFTSANGWTTLSNCSPSQADINQLNLTSASKLYVNCSSYSSKLALNAGTVFFNGSDVSNVTLPNATRVYIRGSSASNGNAIKLTNNNVFAVRGGPAGTTQCSSTSTNDPSKMAKMVIYGGQISASGGMLRLCNTAVIMMGNHSGGCLPATGVTLAPTSTPCSGAAGNSQVSISGGAGQDWTAPNAYGEAVPEAARATAWKDHLEDLALWSESFGGSSNPSYSMAGGSGMRLVGVFMTPNATPFTVTGGGGQTLTNAQYIATRFEVKGGASLTMVVDPDNAVSIPTFDRWTLVR